MADRMIPAQGARAPAFTLDSDEGKKVRLADLKDAPVVVYFYPKDDTPGCTMEAVQFSELAGDFDKLGIRVYGISPDTVESHCNFIRKHSLNVRLLADPEHKVAAKYGAWVEKNLYGRKYWGVKRATFLIDADGRIARVWPNVRPRGHAGDVLAAAQTLP
ncbi:MAG: thioredoxin-dependent thiol peroxidase [Candidatus Hydrogenedentales bacterium]